MSFTPATDFLALLRQAGGGVRTERMPGLDYVVAALARTGLVTLSVSAAAPTVNQSTTVWLKPALPSWTAEGAVFLYNAATVEYEPATPALWSSLLAATNRPPFFTLAGANFNSTADQPIAVLLPAGYTRYRIQSLIVSNPSVPLTTAVGGVYTAAAKGGIAVVAAAQAYSALTTNAAGASGSMLSPTVANQNTAFYNSATLFLSLTTPQGAAATADVSVFIQPLP